MHKPVLDKDRRKLIDLLSLKEAFDDVKRIFAVGERVVGTPGELKAVEIIESRFKEIGLQNVHREPFEVVTSYHELSEMELLEPIRKKIPCGQCNGRIDKQGFVTGPDGYSGSIVDVGFGRIQDLERLKKRGVDFSGKIVLIEENPRVRNWTSIAQSHKFGASAAIITSVQFERDIRRNPWGLFLSVDIPAVSIPYIEAQAIRRLLWEGEVKANLKNVTKINAESTGYNVVGEIPGHKYPNEVIVLTAHHDSWYGGANDDLCGVAVMIQVAKALLPNYENARTIRFVTCGGEEGGLQPGEDEIYRWMTGSYAYTNQHVDELNKVVGNINLDGFAYGLNSTISLTFELEPLVRKFIEELEAEHLYVLFPGPRGGLDQWWFARHGVPTVSINPNQMLYKKIYHSDRDTPELLSDDLMMNGLRLTASLVLGLDSPVLPYDLAATAGKIINAVSERLTRVEYVVDLKRLLENATNFKVIADHLQNRVKTEGNALDEEAIALINDALRRTCTTLIPKLSDIRCGISVDSADTIPTYLDALINIKKAIVAAKHGDKETCTTSLKTLTEDLWGLDYSPEIYESWTKAVVASKRAPGLRFDLMPEARGLVEKFKKGTEDRTAEISSLEEKYEVMSGQIAKKLSEINDALDESSLSLSEILHKIS